MRRIATAGSVAALLLTAAVPVAADPKLQETCTESTKSVAELIDCMKAGAPPTASPAEPECADAHRGPFTALVEGRTVIRFGEKTQYGMTSKGVVLETQHGASVRAPKAGTVVFAGEFRAYGQLIILELGCNLQFTLAGAAALEVKAGEIVANGQTIATMPASAAKPDGSGRPVIYVELRKSGNQVDPGPSIAAP